MTDWPGINEPEMPNDELLERVARALAILGEAAQVDVALSSFTTFRIGGPAAVFVTASSHRTLELVFDASKSSGLSVVTIGQGSNLLVSDTGVAAIVVQLSGSYIDIRVDQTHEHRSVTAGGAVKLPVLARQSVAAGLGGLEWAVGVPGSVGGAVRMNAGGHGSDVAANVQRAQVFSFVTGEAKIVSSSDLHLRYRSSSIGESDVVEWAEFSLEPIDPSAGESELREIVQWRRVNQPGGANCGSVFTNPMGDSAGRLIDAAGLKGFRVATASVSEKHANFIQADVSAKATDVVTLISEIRRIVHEKFGILLEPEVRTLGLTTIRR